MIRQLLTRHPTLTNAVRPNPNLYPQKNDSHSKMFFVPLATDILLYVSLLYFDLFVVLHIGRRSPGCLTSMKYAAYKNRHIEIKMPRRKNFKSLRCLDITTNSLETINVSRKTMSAFCLRNT